MASTATVTWRPDIDKTLCQMPAVKSELTREANSIAMRANAMGAGFRTERTKNYETGEHVGGKSPVYKADKARNYKGAATAMVHTANYAAMKDTHLHNTLSKAL